MSALPPSLPVPLHELPDGTLRVVGTRVPLDTIVYAHLAGDSPETIAANFDTVSLTNVYTCIAYYLRHREEVDDYLARREREAEVVRAENERRRPSDGTKARLLARWSVRGDP